MIIHIRYLEKKYNYPVIIDRNPPGIGSLAEAINRAAKQCNDEFCWIITNADANVEDYEKLTAAMPPDVAAIHPKMVNSDHEFMRTGGVVPFIEFTAACVRAEVLKAYPLDEDMPYWGHDLDWGFRVRNAGYRILVHDEVEVYHTYIRNLRPHPVTRIRRLMRKRTDRSTRIKLETKYGKEWQRVLNYRQ